jgi:hypothetical protein
VKDPEFPEKQAGDDGLNSEQTYHIEHQVPLAQVVVEDEQVDEAGKQHQKHECGIEQRKQDDTAPIVGGQIRRCLAATDLSLLRGILL